MISTLETIVEQVEQTGFDAPAIAVIGQVEPQGTGAENWLRISEMLY